MNISSATLALPLVALLAAGAAAHHPEHEQKTQRQIEVVRKATERFKDVREARRAGYEPAAECVVGPDGGMGVHYTNARLARDPRIAIRHPEILVYEPRGYERRLVAVEYYRPDADGATSRACQSTTTFTRGSGSTTRPARSVCSTRA
jgi:hypothetical protein